VIEDELHHFEQVALKDVRVTLADCRELDIVVDGPRIKSPRGCEVTGSCNGSACGGLSSARGDRALSRVLPARWPSIDDRL
jgi:hypothetical protein